jgi:hypothetical protein
VRREQREPDERRYAAPTLDHALDKLVRVADAHARRLEDVDDARTNSTPSAENARWNG